MCRRMRRPAAAMRAASSGGGSCWQSHVTCCAQGGEQQDSPAAQPLEAAARPRLACLLVACTHARCMSTERTSIWRLRLTRARVAMAHSKPFKLRAGLPTSSTDCGACCCGAGGGGQRCDRPCTSICRCTTPPQAPAKEGEQPQECAVLALLAGAASGSTLLGGAAERGPGQKRWQSTPLWISRLLRPNSVDRMLRTPSAGRAREPGGWGRGRAGRGAAAAGEAKASTPCHMFLGCVLPSASCSAAGRRGAPETAASATGRCMTVWNSASCKKTRRQRRQGGLACLVARQSHCCTPASSPRCGRVWGAPARQRCCPPGIAQGHQTATRVPARSTAPGPRSWTATRAPAGIKEG